MYSISLSIFSITVCYRIPNTRNPRLPKPLVQCNLQGLLPLIIYILFSFNPTSFSHSPASTHIQSYPQAPLWRHHTLPPVIHHGSSLWKHIFVYVCDTLMTPSVVAPHLITCNTPMSPSVATPHFTIYNELRSIAVETNILYTLYHTRANLFRNNLPMLALP